MVGCTLTGVCPSAAADYVKVVTLSDGDALSDGMMVACTFANGNTAGIAPGTLTIYSSDQINYFEDDQLTIPFTLAPSGCYTIEYTGTGNAYTYSSFPVVQVGAVSGILCASNGTPSGGTSWGAGDTVVLLYTGGKFLAINVVTNTVAVGNMHPVTSDAVATSNAMPVDEVTGGNMHSVTSNAVKTTIDNLVNSGSLDLIKLSQTFGRTAESALNIDTIQGSNGYMYCIFDGSYLTGTKPTILEGNRWLLFGMSSINTSNNLPTYGVQVAIGFGNAKIAIRNRNYIAEGGAWSAWTLV